MANKNELHDSRLGTTDEEGHRVFLFPEDVKGIWRDRRNYVYWFLIILYLVLPWIYIGGEQSIRLDIPAREFTLFGHIFYAHNAPLILFLLLGFVFLIGFITSIWGRVWCGWACPQTVFIDAIFRKIEVFVEGNARQRQRLDAEPWSIKKAIIRSFKWYLYLLASLHISHTFLGYFVGTHELLDISMHNPSSNMTLFITMLVITAIVLLDFGWFREQFCIIACPYGRFQSVMMDETSMAIIYDDSRGEPRREPGMKKDEHGDCVNCYACVKSCPTGIDIRRGVQLECIACTNCIDACDDIMLKTKRQPGLIRYDSQANLEGNHSGVRKRSIVYFGFLTIILIGFIYSLKLSNDLQVTVLRGGGTPFKVVQTTQGTQSIVNHLKITLDQSGDLSKKKVQFSTDIEGIELKMPKNPLQMKKNHMRVNLFLKFDPSILTNGSKKINLIINDLDKKEIITKEVTIVGPLTNNK